jgi:hypothetical protein
MIPDKELIMSGIKTSGYLYGTTVGGGAYNCVNGPCGVVYQINLGAH